MPTPQSDPVVRAASHAVLWVILLGAGLLGLILLGALLDRCGPIILP